MLIIRVYQDIHGEFGDDGLHGDLCPYARSVSLGSMTCCLSHIHGQVTQTIFANSQILFLNKADLLAQKIHDPAQQVKDYFPDFGGKAGSFNDAVGFFKQKFRSLNRNSQREIYTYETTAVDTQALKVVMAATQDVIVRNSLRDVGII